MNDDRRSDGPARDRDPVLDYLDRDRGVDERRRSAGVHDSKIVATLGPATDADGALRDLLAAGVDVVRFNMSHGTHRDHTRRLRQVRAAAAELDRPLAVLADLQGPKIRTGRLAGDRPVTWATGMRVIITTDPCPVGSAQRVGTTYPGLAADVAPGDPFLIDDGHLRLRVECVDGADIVLVVEQGGELRSHKGINLPASAVRLPSLTAKDREDLDWALAHEVDYLALSFVRGADDLEDLHAQLDARGRAMPIISKIETPQAVRAIDAILDRSDGIMVARGDLGIEIPTERLPLVQKRLIAIANARGRLVITATQMLDSMVDQALPTRAEVTDVANAVLDGSDAVMLSGETAIGAHPVITVQTMRRIVVEAEHSPYFLDRSLVPGLAGFDSVALSTAAAADRLASDCDAALMVIASSAIDDLELVAKHRPPCPALAACRDPAIARRAALLWGITPLLVTGEDDIAAVIAWARGHDLVASGDRVVVVAGTPRDLERIRVRRVE